ncbi:MAG: hypothetical protein H7X92_02180 [Chitinophagales bacterium]|nr:hypothetical protein [Hyphomicrobiales bacterium]
MAYNNGRILLTEDADFGELAIRFKAQTLGVVRIALKSVDREARNIRVVAALSSLGETVCNVLVVIEPGRIRRRPLRTDLLIL